MKWVYLGVSLIGALGSGIWITGYFLPVAHHVERSLWLQRPVTEVFNLIANFDEHPRWRPGVRATTVSSIQGSIVVEEESDHGTLRYQVEKMEPPRLIVTRIIDEKDFGGKWTISLTEERNGVRVRIREDGEVYSPVFRFFSRFVFSHHGNAEAYLTGLATTFGGKSDFETP